MNYTTAQAQAMCQSQLRAIMSADDQFAATMQLLSDRGVLDNTLVIFSSDNGYKWGEHGRWEKFVPYEPSIRVPLLVRWPGHFTAGIDTTRLVSYLDLLPTMLEAAGFALPATRRGSTASHSCSPPQDHHVQRVLRRRGQPQHPVLADGPHGHRQVRPDLQHRGHGHCPRVLQLHQRPSREHQPAR